MDTAEIIDLLREGLCEVASDRASEFETLDLDKPIEDLGLDSIATMELVGFLEEKLDTTFPDEELPQVNRLRDIVSLAEHGRVGG